MPQSQNQRRKHHQRTDGQAEQRFPITAKRREHNQRADGRGLFVIGHKRDAQNIRQIEIPLVHPRQEKQQRKALHPLQERLQLVKSQRQLLQRA